VQDALRFIEQPALTHPHRPGHRAGLLGHASIATTNLYLQNLGTGADRAGLGDSPRLHVTRPVRPEFKLVELRGFEPLTFSLRTRGSGLASGCSGYNRRPA